MTHVGYLHRHTIEIQCHCGQNCMMMFAETRSLQLVHNIYEPINIGFGKKTLFCFCSLIEIYQMYNKEFQAVTSKTININILHCICNPCAGYIN